MDTNGTIQKYFWDDLQGWKDSTTTDSSTAYQIRQGDINKGMNFDIHVRDDDGLVRGKRFIVFADSAPPKPVDFLSDKSGDSVIVKWNKEQDYKDGMQTRVQIAYCYGAGCTPSDSLYASDAWPTLSEIEATWGTENNGTWNLVKFKKNPAYTTGTTGRWRVILKDARGSKAIGDATTFLVP